MAPIKQRTALGDSKPFTNKTQIAVSTRSKIGGLNTLARSKRKADFSPDKENVKRTALGLKGKKVEERAKPVVRKTVQNKENKPATLKTVVKPKNSESAVPLAPVVNGVVTRSSLKNVHNSRVPNQTALKAKEHQTVKITKTRLSNEFAKSEESSLYSSALEDLNDTGNSSRYKSSTASPQTSGDSGKDANNISMMSFVAKALERQLNLGNHDVPDGVDDFDKENWDDVFQVSHYAMDIFNYFKTREQMFEISDYMERQICLSSWMRSLLVDWMVEVQECFELNHETLYLGVKLVDLYLSRVTVGKETLQLVGAASMFVASKFDERIPPAIDDFLFICDGAYKREELLRMEINLLKVCDFDLGIPLSYRFLRRYARCAKITMPTLTLARYILEYSLMDYATVTVRDSKLAVASLYLALKMKQLPGWSPSLEFYSGYKVSDFQDVVELLNNGLIRKTKSRLLTVKNKYSHKIFFEVAKIPLISNEVALA